MIIQYTTDVRFVLPLKPATDSLPSSFRDEGLEHYRKLMAAGVAACSRTFGGTVHAADLLFGVACPDIFDSTIRDIKSFAERV